MSFPRGRLNFWMAPLGVMGAFFTCAAVAQPPEQTQAAKCDAPLLAVMVIEDQVNVSSWSAERIRPYRLPLPANALRSELAQSGCVTLLDSDPVFAAISAAAQPDIVFRTRFVNVKSAEKSLGEKAGNAVGRYIGAYLGDAGEESPIVKSLEMAVDVICARNRRVVHQLQSQAAGTDSAKAENNADVVSEASAGLARSLIQFLKERPDACGPSR